MNKRPFFSIFLFTLLSFSISTAFARKPAVDPGMGISIDHYDDVPAKQAKGYDWSENKADAVSAPARPVQQQKLNSQRAPSQETTTSSSPYFILGLLAALPFVLWFGIMKGLPEQVASEDNTIDFPSQENSDDDINYPKAS
jgi:hypothetical protein